MGTSAETYGIEGWENHKEPVWEARFGWGGGAVESGLQNTTAAETFVRSGSETACVHENKTTEDGEVGGEVAETEIEDVEPEDHTSDSKRKIQKKLKKALMNAVKKRSYSEQKTQKKLEKTLIYVEESKKEEPPVAEESQIIEECKQDELPSTERFRKVNEDVEKNFLFGLVYPLHKYFDHTELDEVISGGKTKYTSDKCGSEMTASGNSDEAVVLNRINCIDEWFDYLDLVDEFISCGKTNHVSKNGAEKPCSITSDKRDSKMTASGYSDDTVILNRINCMDKYFDYLDGVYLPSCTECRSCTETNVEVHSGSGN